VLDLMRRRPLRVLQQPLFVTRMRHSGWSVISNQ
jgi:hypothetical protein